MTPIRAAVVGLGWAGQQHMTAWANREDAELVGIGGLEPDRRAELADRFAVPTAADLTELLDLTTPDVLSIATPTALHAPMAIAAMERGIDVITEKPMAASAAEAARMVAAAQSNGVVLDVVFNHRLRGEVQALADIIAAGKLGEISYAKAGWLRRAGIPGGGSWFTQSQLSGGGALADIGVHVLDIAMSLLNRPQIRYVTGSTAAIFGPRGLGYSEYANGTETAPFDVEDLAVATLTGADVTIVLETSWAQLREQDRIYVELYGALGGAVLELGALSEGTAPLTIVTGDPANPEISTPEVGEHRRHAGVIEEFVNRLQLGPGPMRQGEQARDLTRIIDACYDSAASRAPVTLSN